MPVMESTTLVTFMLQHSTARSVELLGSWDNFVEPYSMKRDSRRGHGFWTGCHTFRDIICDGDVADIHEGRSGGLKQGGTYWYFYRIDHDEEFYDPSQPSTSACPLMPGQDLNILDVPYDIERFISRSRSSSISISSAVQTLNPDDRYVTPRPAPKPRLPRLITSAEAANASRSALSQPTVVDRARSAIGPGSNPWSNWTRSCEREVKSAASSPTTALKSAFMHLKGPVEALTPSQGGRGRSRILHGDHERHHRTKSPSVRELKKRISRPVTMPSPMDSFLDSTTSSIEMSSAQPRPLFVRKRAHSPHMSVRRLQETERPLAGSEPFPESEIALDRGRSASHRQPRPIAHKRGFSDNMINRRSNSLGRIREPSPLRNVITAREQTRVIDSLQIPTGIPEVDGEDVVSPRKLPNDLSLVGLNSPRIRRRSEPSTPNFESLIHGLNLKPCSPDVEKELPVLPSYLMPQPLSIRSEHSEMEAALQALSYQYSQPAPFSPWRVEVDVPLPESPDSDVEPTGSNSHSPTFSSIKGGTSGACTPYRLSEVHDWPLRSAFGGDFNVELSKGLDNLSLHARTASTTSSTVPYSLPLGFNGNPFAEKTEGQVSEAREMTQMEQLLDEFDYLGAALI